MALSLPVLPSLFPLALSSVVRSSLVTSSQSWCALSTGVDHGMPHQTAPWIPLGDKFSQLPSTPTPLATLLWFLFWEVLLHLVVFLCCVALLPDLGSSGLLSVWVLNRLLAPFWILILVSILKESSSELVKDLFIILIEGADSFSWLLLGVTYSNWMKIRFLLLSNLELEDWQKISRWNIKATIITNSRSLVRKWDLLYTIFDGLLVAHLVFISIFGAMVLLTGSVRKGFGKKKKKPNLGRLFSPRGGEWISRNWIRKKFTLVIKSFLILQWPSLDWKDVDLRLELVHLMLIFQQYYSFKHFLSQRDPQATGQWSSHESSAWWSSFSNEIN